MAKMREYVGETGFPEIEGLMQGEGGDVGSLPLAIEYGEPAFGPGEGPESGILRGGEEEEGELVTGALPGAQTGRGSEGPRDREGTRPRTPTAMPPGGGTTVPTPTRPRTPTPGAGHVSGGPTTGGVVPFTPMPLTPMTGGGEPGIAPLGSTSPTVYGGGGTRMRGILGSQGGLSGGGLGLPFDPVSNDKSDPIALLLEQLMGRK